MVLKLYGYPHATCTKRVAAVLREKRVPFEFIQVDLTVGEHKSPAYLEKQPFGKVPYIDDDGFVLFESRAICRYIATKWADQGTPLIPTDPKEVALFNQASDIEAFSFDPPAYGAASEKLFAPVLGNATNEALLADYIKRADAVAKVYDTILSKQKYTAGDKLTLVDFFHLPYGSLLAPSGSDALTKYPNTAKWWNEISSRESWLAVNSGVIESVASY